MAEAGKAKEPKAVKPKVEAKPPIKGGFYAEEGTYYAHIKCYMNMRVYNVGDTYQAYKDEPLADLWKKTKPAEV